MRESQQKRQPARSRRTRFALSAAEGARSLPWRETRRSACYRVMGWPRGPRNYPWPKRTRADARPCRRLSERAMSQCRRSRAGRRRSSRFKDGHRLGFSFARKILRCRKVFLIFLWKRAEIRFLPMTPGKPATRSTTGNHGDTSAMDPGGAKRDDFYLYEPHSDIMVVGNIWTVAPDGEKRNSAAPFISPRARSVQTERVQVLEYLQMSWVARW